MVSGAAMMLKSMLGFDPTQMIEDFRVQAGDIALQIAEFIKRNDERQEIIVASLADISARLATLEGKGYAERYDDGNGGQHFIGHVNGSAECGSLGGSGGDAGD